MTFPIFLVYICKKKNTLITVILKLYYKFFFLNIFELNYENINMRIQAIKFEV